MWYARNRLTEKLQGGMEREKLGILTNVFYKQREDFAKQQKEQEERFTFPEEVEEITDIVYLEDGKKEHRLNVYQPKERTQEKLPVIVNVHGGGMVIGTKEFNRYYCAELVKIGFLVFSVEYPLIPDCMIYDQFESVSRAMDKIQTLIETYQGNAEKIYAVADSGGACLLTYAAAMQNCGALAEAAGVVPTTLPVRALGLISGMFYTTKLDQIGLFLPRYLYGKGERRKAFKRYEKPDCPEIIKALPPCYLATSKEDMLEHYTLQFAKALKDNGMRFQLKDFRKDKKLTHAFSVFDPYLKESRETMNQMVHFFEKA